jgi:organic radical activating enzyme
MMKRKEMTVNLQQPIGNQEFKGLYSVHEIFSTIQGEGPFAGVPATFIRLAGCNLQCTGCDTDYTGGKEMTRQEIAKSVDPDRLVVITGGEPFRQNLFDLLDTLLNRNIKRVVQIETNGTILPNYLPDFIARGVIVVVSPKTVRSPFAQITDFSNLYFKYPIASGKDSMDDGLPIDVLGTGVKPCRPPIGFPVGRIFITPEDAASETDNIGNLQTAAEVCMKFGYRLGVQLHKYVGMK